MVSVIIVSWNAKEYLVQCLKSLSSGAGQYAMEVIVVDNASTDGSPEEVETNYPHVCLIRNKTNLGFAKGNNIGIRACKGRYICLVNSDVEVLENCIPRLLEYLESHPDVGMVGPRIIGSNAKLQRSCRGFPSLWNMFCRALALDVICPRTKLFGGYLMHYWGQDTLSAVAILSGCFWLVRREALVKVGLLDEDFFMYGEDMDWCKRFWSCGWRLTFVPGAEAIHYGGASSANAPVRFYVEKQKADLHYWGKHHTRLAQQCYFAIACLHHLVRAFGYTLVSLPQWRSAKMTRYKVSRSIECLKWMLSRTTFLSVVQRSACKGCVL